jgi:hypothetical protein
VTERRFGPIFSTALLGAMLVASACKKHEGGSCKATEQVCADKEHALVCRAGQFVTVACPGPLACSRFENHVNCDTTVGNPGDNCMGEDEEYGCSSDKKQVVTCKKGKFEPFLQCRGPTGCAMDGRIPNCDLSIAAKGDPCKKPETSRAPPMHSKCSFAVSENSTRFVIAVARTDARFTNPTGRPATSRYRCSAIRAARPVKSDVRATVSPSSFARVAFS